MSKRTIPKNFVFVIFFLTFQVWFSGCTTVFPEKGATAENGPGKEGGIYGKPSSEARIVSPEISESSGLAASRCQPGVLWTHNDSGDENFIFALDEKGAKLGTWKVSGAENGDWEDLATFRDKSGKCFLYIGDLGNNIRTRSEFAVYRVPEPTVSEGARASSKKTPLATEPAELIPFNYPETRHDAETLMVHPVTGDIYVLTKRVSGPAGVYRIAAGSVGGPAVKASKIADLSVPAIPDGLLTGGDISPDGRRVVVCDYYNAYELVLPEGSSDFGDIWKQKPVLVELGPREQGEAIAYSADGRSLYATSERRNSPLIKVERK